MAAHILGELVKDKGTVARSFVRVFSHHDQVCNLLLSSLIQISCKRCRPENFPIMFWIVRHFSILRKLEEILIIKS